MCCMLGFIFIIIIDQWEMKNIQLWVKMQHLSILTQLSNHSGGGAEQILRWPTVTPHLHKDWTTREVNIAGLRVSVSVTDDIPTLLI